MTNPKNKTLFGGMIFALIGFFTILGIWFLLGRESTRESTGGGGSRAVEVRKSIMETAMNELENMGLPELLKLKKQILNFPEKAKTNFNLDMSGIMEVL